MFDPWLLWVVLVTALWTSFVRMAPPGNPLLCGAVALLLLVITTLAFVWLAWQTRRAMARPGGNRVTVVEAYIQRHLSVSVAAAVVIFLLDPVLGWRTVAAQILGLPRGELVDGLLLCLAWLPVWAVRIYTIERVHAQYNRAVSIFRCGRVATELRQQVLPLLMPLVAYWALNDLGLNQSSVVPPWLDQTLGLGVSVAFILALPHLLAWVWKAYELPASETAGLAAIETLLGVRVRRRWLWPWIRPQALVLMIPRRVHVFFSTGLWQQFDTAGRHAVYAHELAHVRCGHLLRRGVVLVAPILLVTAVLALTAPETAPPTTTDVRLVLTWQKCVQFGVLVVTLGTVFSWVSRMQERQADTMACAVLSRLSEQKQLAEQKQQTEPHLPTRLENLGPLEADTVENFCQLFTLLGVQSSMPDTHQGWLHPSLSARRAWLKQVLASPAAAEELDRQLQQIHWVGLMVTLLSIAALYSG